MFGRFFCKTCLSCPAQSALSIFVDQHFLRLFFEGHDLAKECLVHRQQVCLFALVLCSLTLSLSLVFFLPLHFLYFFTLKRTNIVFDRGFACPFLALAWFLLYYCEYFVIPPCLFLMQQCDIRVSVKNCAWNCIAMTQCSRYEGGGSYECSFPVVYSQISSPLPLHISSPIVTSVCL